MELKKKKNRNEFYFPTMLQILLYFIIYQINEPLVNYVKKNVNSRVY